MRENRSVDDKDLDARLTAEAGDESLPFSQDLHERIMHRIANAPAKSARYNWRWSAIAAGVILAIGLLVNLKMIDRSKPSPKSVAIRNVPSIPQFRNPVRAIDQPMTEWNDARFAYLDRDGQKLFGYMARQVDFMPTQKAR